MKKNKVLAMALIGAMMVGTLAGCGGSKTETTAAPEASGNSAASESQGGEAAPEGGSGGGLDTVVIGMDADPGTMNPWGSSSTALLRTKLNVFQTLYQFDENYELFPVIAESYEQLDEVTYRVKIRDGVYDSTGAAIKASDVLFSMQTASQSPAMGNSFKYVDIDNCSVVDDLTVEFKMKQENVFAFSAIMRQIAIVSEETYKADPDEMVNKPIGSGPYVLDNWIVGSEISFVPNENYWAKDMEDMTWVADTDDQNAGKITYRVISEASQRAIELETGAVDMIYDCQATDISRFGSDPNYTVDVENGTKTINLYFNCSDNSPCSDKLIRQALAYAIDSQALAMVACEGYGEGVCSVAHPATAEWRDSYKDRGLLYNKDVEKAKALLAEAGYGEGELEIHVMVDETAIKRASAQIIQAAAMEIGINFVIDQLETAVFQANIGDLTAWDMYVGVSQSDVYTAAFMNTQIEKTAYPQDTELRKVISEAYRVYDEKAADEAVAMWEEEIPILPLANLQNVYVFNSNKIDAATFTVDKSTVVWGGTFTSAQ